MIGSISLTFLSEYNSYMQESMDFSQSLLSFVMIISFILNFSVCFAVLSIMGLRSARGVNVTIDPARAGIVMAILFGMWVIFVVTIFAAKKTHSQSKISPDNESKPFVTSDGSPLTGRVVVPSKTPTPISNPYLTTRVYRNDGVMTHNGRQNAQFIQGRAQKETI